MSFFIDRQSTNRFYVYDAVFVCFLLRKKNKTENSNR